MNYSELIKVYEIWICNFFLFFHWCKAFNTYHFFCPVGHHPWTTSSCNKCIIMYWPLFLSWIQCQNSPKDSVYMWIEQIKLQVNVLSHRWYLKQSFKFLKCSLWEENSTYTLQEFCHPKNMTPCGSYLSYPVFVYKKVQ